MVKRGIPLAAMERILEKAGADRISDGAKEELRAVCVELVHEIGKRSVKFAEHAGRKTVKEEDITLATKHLF